MQPTMKKQITQSLGILVVLTVIVGTSVGALMHNNKHEDAVAPTASATDTQSKTLEVTQETAEAATVPTDTPVPAPAPVASPKTKAITQQVAAPTVYKWASYMAIFEIPESEYAHVTAMVLDDNGWRTTGPNLWSGNGAVVGIQNNEASIRPMLQRANAWVTKNYGDWSTAYAAWITNGNF